MLSSCRRCWQYEMLKFCMSNAWGLYFCPGMPQKSFGMVQAGAGELHVRGTHSVWHLLCQIGVCRALVAAGWGEQLQG